MGKIIIIRKDNKILLFLMEDKRPSLIAGIEKPEKENILGNIYLAKVKDVIPAMNGAFLSISKEQTVFLPLTGQSLLESGGKYQEDGILRQGDEVVVQIAGEAVKTKPPVATGKLTLIGQYIVVDYFGRGITFSKKISKEVKERLKKQIFDQKIKGRNNYRFTVRTNAGELADPAPLFDEMQKFTAVFDGITDTWQHRTCFSCLYHTESELVKKIQGIPLSSYEEIVTDDDEMYHWLKEVFPDSVLRLYQDDMLSLSSLYSLETHLKEALAKRVWLPSGGYLVIEPTEAMVVIDVNTGKGSKGKSKENIYLKINLEAAKEIARQLRIRNYSGMIMVDFINMESEKDKKTLLESLDRWLKEDRIYTRLVDMTALGIVEITRKKVSRPLSDFFMQM